MIDEKFVILAAILALIGGGSYLIETLKGKTRPNKVTWFIWALAPLIAFAAQLSQGVGLKSLLTFMAGFSPLLIFLASFVNKNASWKIEKFDLVCGAFSILGLLLWWLTKVGNIAIFFSILADLLAAAPTIIKSYQRPESESYWIYFMYAVASIITILTIKVWTFENYGFPIYLFLICTLLFILIKFKLGKYSFKTY